MERDHETPGTLLALLMRRRGWSAPRLAEVSGGVSPSSIRAYLSDRTTPRPHHALALATAVGPVDGKALLEAWGFTDLADHFHEQFRGGGDDRVRRLAGAVYRLNRIEYDGEPLSEEGLAVIQAIAGWAQHLEQVAAGKPRPSRRKPPEH